MTPAYVTKPGHTRFTSLRTRLLRSTPSCAASNARVDVIFWFDTDDYLLPANDGALGWCAVAKCPKLWLTLFW
jgi:hypothetical protein